METIPQKIGRDKPLVMDKAYEGDSCRKKAKECKMVPVVPPKNNRKQKWEYDQELYKHRNIIERHFRNIKEFRRVFTRYDKLDETYNAFISIANIIVFLRN
jgi:transposase